MTLAEALRDITQRITCVDWDDDENRAKHISPVGIPYIVLCSGGIKEESGPEPCMCSSKEIAVATWRAALLEYEAARHGVLYWRTKPELMSAKVKVLGLGDCDFSMGIEEETWWLVYSRLLISDKSVIRTVKRAAIS